MVREINASPVDRRKSESILATNTVIRNTYILLSLTLIFSAITATASVIYNVPPLNPIMVLGGYMGLLFLVSALRNTIWGIVGVFALTGFMGVTLGPLLNFTIQGFSNGGQLIGASLGLTGIIFLSLSGYALTTKKDFSYLGGFLFVGLIFAMIASIGAIFFHIPALHLAISGAFVLLSSGMILFETSRLVNGGERNYIMATISLYVSLYNIFVSLLHIISVFAGRRN